MKFHVFGKQNGKTVMFIHGLGTTWDKSFSKVIALLQGDFHVIAAGLDGHDPEEKTNYISGEREAEQVERFIRDNLGGRIDVIYGSSLGCVTALLTAYRRNVTVSNIILDGTVDTSLGILNKPVSKFAGWFGEQVLKGKMNWFLKLGGVTPEMLNELLYSGISRTTLKNAFYDGASMFTYVNKMEPCNGVRLACWYGTNEKSAARGARKIRKAFPKGKDTIFEGFGHGEILLHPEQFCKELRRILNFGA
ncbi:alpha/beta fold hydrolase [Anaerobium acetethylicum]|uniref:Pimeloyl-ACP methyl ester carboxylesterase n=1 Tax=Anaerobium acetethylicum TaxID=1619234 RepID=A0A1D3TU71_9FIRM|nr:alpha/beta hydrolase [Anaerobium acetethylicum]SCP97603.1 Pimeloyl-ACP methyl ester carboxylesterase [Anaerobium acetethylicum]